MGLEARVGVLVSRVAWGRALPCLRLSSLVGGGTVRLRARGVESHCVRVVGTCSPVWVGVLLGRARLSSD